MEFSYSINSWDCRNLSASAFSCANLYGLFDRDYKNAIRTPVGLLPAGYFSLSVACTFQSSIEAGENAVSAETVPASSIAPTVCSKVWLDVTVHSILS